MKRKLRLKIQKVRRQSITVAGEMFATYCANCGQEVEMLSRAQAVQILEVEEEALNVLISGNVVHAIETVSGSQRICKNSLFVRTRYPERL